MFSYTNPEWFAPEVDKERKSVQNSPVSENELVQDFLDGKRENKPATLAKPYLQKMKQVFERVTKAKESLTIIAFRHGDKTPEGDLSETGEKQAKQLGETLKTRDEQTMHTLYIATHNTINESIVRMLISTEQLPKEWRTPLNFAEPVIYRFHADIPDQEPTLEIERRGIKKQILFDDLKQILA
jgi:hypothetical protein